MNRPSFHDDPASHAGTRREFLLASGAGIVAATTAGGCTRPRDAATPGGASAERRRADGGSSRVPDLATIPNFCAHEHWGSIASIGMAAEGFRADVEAGATPGRTTTLIDLVLDPYLGGPIHGAGDDPNAAVRAALGMANAHDAAVERPAETLHALRPILHRQQLNGIYQALRRGILFAHDYDLHNDDAKAIAAASRSIGERYAKLFDWYSRLMALAHFSALIRPVHPEYYARPASPETARAEAALTRTLLRIDPLLDLWRPDHPRRAALAAMAGVDPQDAASWRRFLDRLFDIAAKGGAVGIKQLQAYRRPLRFELPADNAVRFTGDLTPAEQRVFEDWVVHECCRRADDRAWPHQVHVGTHNLPDSDPLPIAPLAQRYRRQKLVLIHCWPYFAEAGFLAREHANIYMDSCWLPVLSPAFFREAMQTWLAYVPLNKIMCSHDSTSVEMAVGSSLVTREILADALAALGDRAGLGADALHRVAADALHNNAVAVYGIGEPVAA